MILVQPVYASIQIRYLHIYDIVVSQFFFGKFINLHTGIRYYTGMLSGIYRYGEIVNTAQQGCQWSDFSARHYLEIERSEINRCDRRAYRAKRGNF